MRLTDVYTKTYEATRKTSRFVSSRGGTRSGKTISILQLMFFIISLDQKPTINSVVSETMPHLKRGAIRDFKTQLAEYIDPDRWSEGNFTYTFPNGSILEFFSVDTPAKVHGPARDRLFINEGQNLEWETIRQLLVRTRGLVWIDYNPTHTFWVQERIENRDTCVTIHSTYLDNRDRETGESMLTEEQVTEIESNKNDSNWWRVYGEGRVGVLEGLVFPDFEQVDALPEKADGMTEVWGMDYGFTNDPTTLIHCYVDNRKKEIWLDERLYRTGMLNEDIAAVMKQEKIGRAVRVYADSAEPKTNETIRRYGFNIVGSYKATKIAEQLQAMKGYKIYVTKRSLNLIRELRSYVWMKDKNGEWLNEPVDVLNHAIDAARYAVFPVIKVHKESHSTLSRT